LDKIKVAGPKRALQIDPNPIIQAGEWNIDGLSLNTTENYRDHLEIEQAKSINEFRNIEQVK